ncbi:MAG: SAF domain-containing protein, partial [Acidimicrobiia bacterium]|nr:SAF domain-containing protein [Acidimicrobiia bacterium]
MLWLARPPYLRRIAAGLVLVAAIAVDVAGSATVEHPFLTTPVAAGSPIEPGMIELRAVPAGLLPAVTDVQGYAARALDAGDPLTPSALAEV